MHQPNLLISKIILFSYLLPGLTFSQWEAGGGYSVKNQYPFNGLTFFLERRLPYQGAGMGVNVRGAFEYFSGNETSVSGGGFILKTYNSNVDLSILVNFFYKYVKPYAGLGIGAGNYRVQSYGIESNTFVYSDNDEWKFITKLFAGLKLTVHEYFQPFIQVHLVKYFGSLEEFQYTREIKSAQYGGTAGLSFSLF